MEFLRNVARALRPHQWAKNVLLFVPLLAAHRVREPDLLLRTALAFASFCLAASATYVLNDVLDVEHDRLHPRKRLRPFASGALSPATGYAIAVLFGALAVGVALLVGAEFLTLLLAYGALTLAYSFALKRVAVLDVIVLAGLYTIRIYSGSVAAGVVVTEWLATFSMFLFLSLALVKRASELFRLGPNGAAAGRSYAGSDALQLSALGASSGFISVLVLALYLSGEHVRTLYTHPGRLWLLCPIALYWTGRLWFLASRGLVDEDPVVFTLKDHVSWVVLGAAAVVVVFAS